MSNPSWKIFVVSLRRIGIRRQQVLRQLLPLHLPFEIVDAVDAEQIQPEFLVRGENAGEMPDGAIACYQSHLGILERIMEYQLDYGLVLEDDFVLQESSALNLRNLWDHLPAGADHIQLHGMKDFLSEDYAVEEDGERFNKLAVTNVFTVGYVTSKPQATGWARIPKFRVSPPPPRCWCTISSEVTLRRRGPRRRTSPIRRCGTACSGSCRETDRQAPTGERI